LEKMRNRGRGNGKSCNNHVGRKEVLDCSKGDEMSVSDQELRKGKV
jgi:hypothetical protein